MTTYSIVGTKHENRIEVSTLQELNNALLDSKTKKFFVVGSLLDSCKKRRNRKELEPIALKLTNPNIANWVISISSMHEGILACNTLRIIKDPYTFMPFLSVIIECDGLGDTASCIVRSEMSEGRLNEEKVKYLNDYKDYAVVVE